MGYDGYSRFWWILRAVSIGYNLWTLNLEPLSLGISDLIHGALFVHRESAGSTRLFFIQMFVIEM